MSKLVMYNDVNRGNAEEYIIIHVPYFSLRNKIALAIQWLSPLPVTELQI
jgi:hypothetical protein